MVGRMLGAARLQNDASIVPYKLVAMFMADFKVSPRRDKGIPPYWMMADIDKYKATPHSSRLAAEAPRGQLRHGICVAKMLDKTSSIICPFGLASAAPRSPYRHLELCGIALINQ